MKKTMLIWTVLVLCLALLAGCAAPLNTGSAVSSGSIESPVSSEAPTSSVPASSIPEVSSVPDTLSEESLLDYGIQLRMDPDMLHQTVSQLAYIDRDGVLHINTEVFPKYADLDGRTDAISVGGGDGMLYILWADGSVTLALYGVNLGLDPTHTAYLYEQLDALAAFWSEKKVRTICGEYMLSTEMDYYYGKYMVASGVKYGEGPAIILQDGRAAKVNETYALTVIEDPEWTDLVQVKYAYECMYGLRKDGTVLVRDLSGKTDETRRLDRKTTAFIPNSTYAITLGGEIYDLAGNDMTFQIPPGAELPVYMSIDSDPTTYCLYYVTITGKLRYPAEYGETLPYHSSDSAQKVVEWMESRTDIHKGEKSHLYQWKGK